MRVRFRTARVVDDARKGTPDEERYEAGRVYDLPAPSALRWINRGLADPVADEPAQPPPRPQKATQTKKKAKG